MLQKRSGQRHCKWLMRMSVVLLVLSCVSASVWAGRWAKVENYQEPDPVTSTSLLSTFPEMKESAPMAFPGLPGMPDLPGNINLPGTPVFLPYSGGNWATGKDLLVVQYIPDRPSASPAIVLVLHGCNQEGRGYAAATGWTTLADKRGFFLVVPQQTRARQPLASFFWFDPLGQGREEARTIMAMIDQVKKDNRLGDVPIYVTGLSAGGAMTAVMLANYPKSFAGGAIISGLPYDGFRDAMTASMKMRRPPDPKDNIPSPEEWGKKVRDAAQQQGPWPPVSIWHSANDDVVNFGWGVEIAKQWANIHGIALSPEQMDTRVSQREHHILKDSNGKVAVELYWLKGYLHGTPVNPGEASDQGGSPGAWVLVGKDANDRIWSSYYIAEFWKIPSGAN